MHKPLLFGPRTPSDTADICGQYPLAWIIPMGDPSALASLLPLELELDTEQHIVALRGHYARANPHVALLQSDPRALVLFKGPEGYISPSWMRDRAQAPTWNYACVQLRVAVEFKESSEETLKLLQDQVAHHEAGRLQAWSAAEMGVRYASLSQRIVGFRARVLAQHSRFKLGQDERPDVLHDILHGLERSGGGELARWMRKFNPFAS